MTTSNSDVLRSYFEEVINKQKLDKIPLYISQKFVAHGSPYVGMGVMIDDSSKIKVTIKAIYPGSPADGKLQVGDEILHVHDGEHTFSTYDELRDTTWGQGVLGTSLTMQVKRGGKELDITLTRGMIEGFSFTFPNLQEMLMGYFKDWSEVHTDLIQVFESGDMVAYFCNNRGHNNRFHRSAAWGECGIVRIHEGKIVDWWAQENELSQMKQLGYMIQAPMTVKV